MPVSEYFTHHTVVLLFTTPSRITKTTAETSYQRRPDKTYLAQATGTKVPKAAQSKIDAALMCALFVCPTIKLTNT